MRCPIVALLMLVAMPAASLAQTISESPAKDCGQVLSVATHNGTTTRFALASAAPAATSAGQQQIALLLLVGGGGYLDLDEKGCPRRLARNALMRMRPLLQAAGLTTVLVDAPSDAASDDGLAGFRNTPEQAADLGRVIADVRNRTGASVWVAGHSRGSISAANAAARLSGTAAPDGVILLSAMMVGDSRARKPWVAQTVFDLPLEAIAMPVLLIGHAADNCQRSPAALLSKIAARTRSPRQQVVAVTGGPVAPGRPPSLAACEVHQPHDYVDQETEVAAGILRFVRGGSF